MGATFGLAGLFAGAVLAVVPPLGHAGRGDAPVVRVEVDEDAFARFKASIFVMRGVFGCEALDIVFDDSDKAVIEGHVKKLAHNYTRADAQRAWDEVESEYGKELDQIYWSPQRNMMCTEFGQASEELLGVDLPGYEP